MSKYYGRDGQPITRDEWTGMFDRQEKKRVAVDEIGDVRISTVWLGLDHQFGEGPPLIFETMVFGGPDGEWQDRYSTEDEALAGHQRVVDKVRAGERLESDNEGGHQARIARGADGP